MCILYFGFSPILSLFILLLNCFSFGAWKLFQFVFCVPLTCLILLIFEHFLLCDTLRHSRLILFFPCPSSRNQPFLQGVLGSFIGFSKQGLSASCVCLLLLECPCISAKRPRKYILYVLYYVLLYMCIPGLYTNPGIHISVIVSVSIPSVQFLS